MPTHPIREFTPDWWPTSPTLRLHSEHELASDQWSPPITPPPIVSAARSKPSTPTHFLRPPLTIQALSGSRDVRGQTNGRTTPRPTTTQAIILSVINDRSIGNENIDPVLLALDQRARSTTRNIPTLQNFSVANNNTPLDTAQPNSFAPLQMPISPPQLPECRPAPNAIKEKPNKNIPKASTVSKIPGSRGRGQGRGRGRGRGGRGGRGGGGGGRGGGECGSDIMNDAPEPQQEAPIPRPRPRPRPRLPAPVSTAVPAGSPPPSPFELPPRSRLPPRQVDGTYAPQSSITAAKSAATLTSQQKNGAVGVEQPKRKSNATDVGAEKRKKKN